MRHVVRRLGHHPSIVLWSGNNENQAIAYYRGTAPIVDYSVLYDGIIKTTLWEEVNLLATYNFTNSLLQHLLL